MKQKKINDILYVFQVTPYEITEDTDAHVIKVQLESYDGFVELNESLASKFVKYNYEMFTVHQQEWAPYVDAKEDADLEWSSDSATAIVGETNTYPTLTNTDNVEVTYDSSDTSVATIASDGTITLLEAGTTTISAIFAGDDTYNAKTVSYSLTVKEVPDLAWSSDSATAIVGETNTYPTLTNTDNVDVTYSSSDTSVASIASDGTVTILAAGSTTISAAFAGDTTYVAKTVSYSLTVKEVPDLSWSSDSATATVGETNTYPTLTNTDNVEVTYDSSDTSVATIASDGTITLFTAGTTTISAIFAGNSTYAAKTVSYLLTVNPSIQPTYDITIDGDNIFEDYIEVNINNQPVGVQSSYTGLLSGTTIDIYPTKPTRIDEYEAISGVIWDTDHWTATISNADIDIIINFAIPNPAFYPLTIHPLESGTISFSNSGVSYRINDGEWTVYTENTPISVNKRDRIEWKCASQPVLGSKFSSTCEFGASGNVMSLIDPNDYAHQTSLSGKPYAFDSLFAGTDITDAFELALPATTLEEGCYYGMFEGCQSLTTGPNLPAVTLAYKCYERMFYECSSLSEFIVYAENFSEDDHCFEEWLTDANTTGRIWLSPYNTKTSPMELPRGWTIEYFDTIMLDYSQRYFGLVGSSVVYFTGNTANQSNIRYSTDGGTTWQILESQHVIDASTPVIFKGSNLTVDPTDGIITFYCATGSATLFGNVMSLIHGDNFANVTTLTNDNQFKSLFKGSYVTNATRLILPATTLTTGCYESMFENCTALERGPEKLPATTLAQGCYQQMFKGCTSLIFYPILLATTLTQYCYQQMFYECTSLVETPPLAATTLAQGCYQQMFKGCTQLIYVTCLATDISASNCITDWLTDTAASGTFYKDPNMTDWVLGTNVPSGWTIEDWL